jgi:hypothetical protein
VTALRGAAAGEGNEQDNWFVAPQSGGAWLANTKVRLHHVHGAGWALHSHGQADQTLTGGLFEVTAVERGDENDWFLCEVERTPVDARGRHAEASDQKTAIETITTICRNFDRFARQINLRHDQRPGFEFATEFDVQDALHSILLLHFDDVRPEEFVPSVGGAAGRVDFLIPKVRVAVETKMTRERLKDREVMNELAEDAVLFRKHPDVDYLFCFVYDPQRLCANPVGIERDLSTEYNHPKVVVVINPQ